MANMLVTCPESGHLERIDYELHPFGMLISACSSFCEDRPDCPRVCAARLDRRRGHSMDTAAEVTKVEVPCPRVLEVRSLLRRP